MPPRQRQAHDRPHRLSRLPRPPHRRTQAAQTPPPPQSVDIASFGDVAALWDLAHSIGLVDLIDRILPKRRQGLSTGQYLLLAAINRAVHPTSKTQLADWHRQTALARLLPAKESQLSSQAFWNHMDAVGEQDIQRIETRILRAAHRAVQPVAADAYL